MSKLTFDLLRAANTARLPTFKNNKGEPSHTEADGSDWSLNDWMTAVTGEVGELASICKSLRRGDYALDDIVTVKGVQMTARAWAAQECADIATYLDLIAKRFGIDLGQAVVDKFNEISLRVGSPITIERKAVAHAGIPMLLDDLIICDTRNP